MQEIERLISLNGEKLGCLVSYSHADDMLVDMLKDSNFTAIKELNLRKKALATSIDLLDDKIIEALAALKKEKNIEDISQLSAADYPRLAELKDVSLKVLKKLAEITERSKQIKLSVDRAFDDYREEDGKFDREKLMSFTADFLNRK